VLNVPKRVKNQVFRLQGPVLPILKLGVLRRHARESPGPLATRGGCPVAEKFGAQLSSYVAAACLNAN